MESCDVLIIGASFSGLTLGHHLPANLKTVIFDRKTLLNTAIESTGLITQQTKDLFETFVDIEKFIPNQITTIGVVSPDYNKYFFSHTNNPWIYSTDTPELVKYISEKLPDHVELRLGTGLLSYEIKESEEYSVIVTYLHQGQKKQIATKFLVGADGSHSTVAKLNPNLSKNKTFLAGHEKVFYGDIAFGEHPENTIYHFWFGEFSLGYGGWLSPTIIEGRKAFRLGLAKLEKDVKDLKKIDEFIQVLVQKNIIHIEGDAAKPVVAFGHLIPIGGILSKVYDKHTLLIGDAAGFCGAFAADGIKGSVVSGKVAGQLIPKYLKGDTEAFENYHQEMQKYSNLITYYKKQVLYRKLWNRMKSDRTFHAMYDLIARQKDSFLYQFCDSKDKQKSLVRVVLKFKNIPLLIKYSCCLILDLFK
jgi:flavin-dependent dehydrogenase